ncbi:extracellular solute-binding protein [Streptomyces hoynatensis]|uniref:extracellular solute-binding protein n=1 Tax=Streptomyces hoynatensis TaxID=1141874 RepID=UPI00131A0CD3|nr:extracellular solute-binding protein [Streptomyces hoynatensis]
MTFLLGWLAAACGGSGGSGPDVPPDDGRPLVVVSGADLTATDEGGSVHQRLIDDWNRDHSRKARLVELPAAEDGQRGELIAALQSGAGDFDVLNVDTAWIPELAEAGLIRELDEDQHLLDADFLPQAAAAGRWEGRTYGVPFNSDVGLLYFRQDLLERQGRDAGDLAADGMADLVHDWPGSSNWLYVTQLRPYEGLTVNTLEAFWSEGVELVDSRGRYQGSEAALERGLTALRQIATPGKLNDASYEADESASIAEFADPEAGTVLMRNWPFAYAQVAAAFPPGERTFGVTELPGTAALGGQSLVLSASSARAADAMELMRFLTSEDSQRKLLDAGFAPALRDAYPLDDPDHLDCDRPRTVLRPAAGETPPGEEAGESGEAGDGGGDAAAGTSPSRDPEYAALLWCALRQAHQRPATPYYPEFSQLLRTEVAALLGDGAGDERDVRSTAEDLDELLPLALDGRLPEPSAGG